MSVNIDSMDSRHDKELTPEPDQRTMGTLGTLFLLNRKTQQDLQSFPIDGDRVTIGRSVNFKGGSVSLTVAGMQPLM